MMASLFQCTIDAHQYRLGVRASSAAIIIAVLASQILIAVLLQQVVATTIIGTRIHVLVRLVVMNLQGDVV